MELSPVLAGLGQYPFARLDDWRADARRRGIDVIDFGVGDPREPTPAFIREALVDGMGIKPKFAFGPLRTAVSGRRVSPPLFESMEILGKSATLTRLRALRATL